MAAHNAPKNDFAPAWLKIPTQENPKSSGSKHLDHMSDKPNRPRREENYHNSFNRYGPDYARLHRQHSFDNYFESGKRYPPNQGKYRHHSVDDEFYPYPYGHYGYYNGYPGYDKFGMQYSSQPTLFRPPRDGKYQHPNTRFNQVNGGYPGGYYDLYPYDYYPGEPPYYPGYPPGPPSGKRSYYNKESRSSGSNSNSSSSKDSKEKEGEKKKEENEKEPPFTDDFPSLNGSEENSETKNTKSPSGGGVWDNRPIGKGKGEDGEYSYRGGQGGANIYKSLIPKNAIVRKTPREAARVNGGSKDQSPLASVKPLSPTLAQAGKESSRQSPTPQADLLKVVTQPKVLGDKKSNFLKTLRSDTPPQENGVAHDIQENGDSEEKSSDEQLSNGMEELQVNEKGRRILSSSLEAEQRLLREMGWNEQDEEEYVITEDDMKEFQKLTDMVKKTPRNGLVRTLPKTWSPKHTPMYQLPETQELNETLSSSDTETEDDS